MYTLQLTDKQLYTVKEACDLYARIRVGHFNEIWSVLVFDSDKNGGTDGVPDHNMWRAICDMLKRFWFPNLPNGSANWGVGHDKHADRSWTICEVITAFLTNDKPEKDRNGFELEQAINWVADEPMPVCSKIEG